MRWLPRVDLANGSALFNVALIGDEAVEMFLLEIPGEPENVPRAGMPVRPIAVSRKWLRGDFEKLANYLRWKALEWLNVACENEREALLRADLRRWREQRGLSLRPSNARGTPWTNDETELLRERYEAGASLQELARLHLRTVAAIRCRLARLAA